MHCAAILLEGLVHDITCSVREAATADVQVACGTLDQCHS